ncbi:hypothetical protein ES705_22757 [subsurface metagenome]
MLPTPPQATRPRDRGDGGGRAIPHPSRWATRSGHSAPPLGTCSNYPNPTTSGYRQRAVDNPLDIHLCYNIRRSQNNQRCLVNRP